MFQTPHRSCPTTCMPCYMRYRAFAMPCGWKHPFSCIPAICYMSLWKSSLLLPPFHFASKDLPYNHTHQLLSNTKTAPCSEGAGFTYYISFYLNTEKDFHKELNNNLLSNHPIVVHSNPLRLVDFPMTQIFQTFFLLLADFALS